MKNQIYINDPLALKTLGEYQEAIEDIISKESDGLKLKLMKKELERNEDSFQDMISAINEKLKKRNIFSKVKDFIKEIVIGKPDIQNIKDLVEDYEKVQREEIIPEQKRELSNERASRNKIVQEQHKKFEAIVKDFSQQTKTLRDNKMQVDRASSKREQNVIPSTSPATKSSRAKVDNIEK